MKTQAPYFIIGIMIIVISTPLAYKSVDILYRNQNLTGEYIPILNGFIHSFMLIGLLIFSIGIFSLIKCKK
ncbi:glycosyl transferase [Brevibacillus daliensis]|uniref:glycosyl transferase n=1 Tax=Brevibacillus daliensis TaxID=2892995 RepID=UPI001E5EE330|nr:glycosyl transferase [Brevibacillus daliensis]